MAESGLHAKLNAVSYGGRHAKRRNHFANLTLDGLERLLKQTFRRRKIDGKMDNPKVNFVRHADGFILTGNSKELLENKVKPLVEQFLSERGLQLSPEKTCITHIEGGFGFLGQKPAPAWRKAFITP